MKTCSIFYNRVATRTASCTYEYTGFPRNHRAHRKHRAILSSGELESRSDDIEEEAANESFYAVLHDILQSEKDVEWLGAHMKYLAEVDKNVSQIRDRKDHFFGPEKL